ncbi:hypothetical protein PoB_005425400 [Plakobranchus ocellatus]|uniref:Uncharacterized protein n=1 Tax=Plakobranchus ocellatus TaxID=259542 RepID=A0AAV4CAL8_9GAST|nr:hypothetical protein PoB_005425400 [Plakobranchus ocellatus]
MKDLEAGLHARRDLTHFAPDSCSLQLSSCLECFHISCSTLCIPSMAYPELAWGEELRKWNCVLAQRDDGPYGVAALLEMDFSISCLAKLFMKTGRV